MPLPSGTSTTTARSLRGSSSQYCVSRLQLARSCVLGGGGHAKHATNCPHVMCRPAKLCQGRIDPKIRDQAAFATRATITDSPGKHFLHAAGRPPPLRKCRLQWRWRYCLCLGRVIRIFSGMDGLASGLPRVCQLAVSVSCMFCNADARNFRWLTSVRASATGGSHLHATLLVEPDKRRAHWA